MDLGYKGSKYTCSNHRKSLKSIILEQLDRVFVTNDWMENWPNANVNHLPKTHFDHNPLLISLTNRYYGRGRKPIRLEKY